MCGQQSTAWQGYLRLSIITLMANELNQQRRGQVKCMCMCMCVCLKLAVLSTHQAAAELCCIKGRQEAQRAHCEAHHRWQRCVLGKQAGEVTAQAGGTHTHGRCG